jgi:hypothetical protein
MQRGPARRDVVETDQIDILPLAVLCDFEQIENAEESGSASERRRDVGQADGVDGVDFDLTFFHPVPRADANARMHPDADRAGDFAAADAFAEAFGEKHGARITGSSSSEVGADWLSTFRARDDI